MYQRRRTVFPVKGGRNLPSIYPPAGSDLYSMSNWLNRRDTSSSLVNLNVGGYHFTTSIQTLEKDPNSTLAALFSGRFERRPSEDGSLSFFIDRDGTHFRFILSYLRTGKISLPEVASFHEELLQEAEFYQIQGLIAQLKLLVPASDPTRRSTDSFEERLTANNAHRCCLPPCRFLFRTTVPRPFEESKILTKSKHRNALKRWLPPGSISKWRLLFRASRDGFAASAFHSKCDNNTATVTIVKCQKYIFGGYKERWIGEKSTKPFLFSMVNPHRWGPTKIPLKKHSSMFNPSGPGPRFGYGDLEISDNANINVNSYSKLGGRYECPRGKDALFTGSNNFTVTDYEVFGLHE